MAVISLYPSDKTACGLYRLVWPGEALAALGHDVYVNEFQGDHEIDLPVYKRATGTGLEISVGPVEADVVVFQRPCTEAMIDIIEQVQAQGVKVVVELDDALWAIHRDNIAWANYNLHKRFHWKWIRRAMRAADLVTTTTPELLEQIDVDGIVIPNHVPESALEVGEKKLDGWGSLLSHYPQHVNELVIGWAATSVTHPDDPSVTNEGVALWTRANDAHFRSVGGKLGREPELFGFDSDKDAGIVSATNSVGTRSWFDEMSALDVSLVPLTDSKFNQAKSWLKGLESAATGCAVIMSPTPDNRRLAGKGIGILAKDRKWRQALNKVRDHSLALEQAKANWEVAREMTIEANANRWLDAWESVADPDRTIAPPQRTLT